MTDIFAAVRIEDAARHRVFATTEIRTNRRVPEEQRVSDVRSTALQKGACSVITDRGCSSSVAQNAAAAERAAAAGAAQITEDEATIHGMGAAGEIETSGAGVSDIFERGGQRVERLGEG